MNIAYIYTALTTIGGADRIIIQKANYLADKLGYTVHIITDSQNDRPLSFPLSPNVKHIDLKIDFGQQYQHNTAIRFLVYKHLMRLYRKRLTALLFELKPDIIISTLGRETFFLPDLDYKCAIIGESHIAKPYMRNLHLMKAKGGIYKLIAMYYYRKQEKAVRKLDALVVLTNKDAQRWVSMPRTTVIPNPLTLKPARQALCLNKEVISVGRLSEQKGYDLLIKAWEEVTKRHPDWTLNIYGEGVLKKELEAGISSLNLTKQVIIHDTTPAIADKYINSAFYVMSSRFEGFGLVLMEAMSCGLPCISFDCPFGPSEIITDKEDGILVENGNTNELANAICFLIENEQKRIEMGNKAIMNIQRYSEQNIMQQWDKLFKSLRK